MKVLITGANGFIGKNLVSHLQEIENLEIIKYDINGTFDKIENSINEINFIFHLAGINRPQTKEEFYEENTDLTKKIVNLIKEKNIKFNNLITNLEPLGFFDYVALQKHAFCVLSDSKTIPEESAVLNFPGVSLRNSTEMPEVLDAGSIVFGGINGRNIINSIELAVNSYQDGVKNPIKDYRDINVSLKVVKIIQSYYNIVNEKTWKKIISRCL